jgi:hypothetical protein
MKKTLTALALFTALTAGVTAANAQPLHIGHNAGLQNYYYYFGSNCCGSTMVDRGGRPCGPVAAPCAPTCAPIAVVVPMEQKCVDCPKPCDPCDSGWSIF